MLRWLGFSLLVLLMTVPCVRASGPDPTTLYSGLVTPFNAALTITLGFLAVLLLIKWIRRAINMR